VPELREFTESNAMRSRTASTQDRTSSSEHLASIELPPPTQGHDTSVLRALRQRKTTREIREKKLPLRQLSSLLWAAHGVNRKNGPFGIPGRTAASASNSQEIDLYVAMQEGVYVYDAVHHRLVPVIADDVRALTISPGQAKYVARAPVHLIYIVDIGKLINTSGYQESGLQDPEIQKSYYYVDTGLIASNVYLFAASQGLACWFHNCNKPVLRSKLALRADQRVLFAQTIGYPIRKSRSRHR
jgi:nitroreductase